jgi:hypothetical protein
MKSDCGHAHYETFTVFKGNCDLVEEAGPNACFVYHVARAGFRKGWATFNVMKNTQIFLVYQ